MKTTTLDKHYALLAARFDQEAKQYDLRFGPPSGSNPGNPLVTWLRQEHLHILQALLPQSAAVLDIGCGTGEEALALAREGYCVLGIDISAAMVRQAQTKAAAYGLRRGIVFRTLPAGKLGALDERGPFAGAYASLGTLNSEPNLAGVAVALHELLEPNAPFVATVMNRRCLFERWHAWKRLRPRDVLPRPAEWAEGRAGASDVSAPVRFYSPDEFALAFSPYFTVEHVMAFPLFLPPVHMHTLYREKQAYFQKLEARERAWRVRRGLRSLGDHFLMVLRHTGTSAS